MLGYRKLVTAGLVSLVMRWRLVGSPSLGGAQRDYGGLVVVALALQNGRGGIQGLRDRRCSAARSRRRRGFQRVVAPERRNIQSCDSLLISSFSFSGANSWSVTEECWPITDPRGYANEEPRQGRTQKLRAHYANRPPWNQEGQFPSLSVIHDSGCLLRECDRFGNFLQELGHAFPAPKNDCHA
jgi:hypothetical protein